MSDADIQAAFSTSYEDARGKFLAACTAHGFAVESLRNDEAEGLDGGALYTDVARKGPADAARVILISSGTHGIEGYCGSGCQVALMQEGAFDTLPDDTRVMLVHAVNPYGFAHQRRVNEDNIDLNRNFVPHTDGTYPDSSAYAEIHGFIAPPDYGARPKEWNAATLSWISEHGMGKFQPAVSGGQYVHPDGLFYGGRGPAWSNRMFRKLMGALGEGVRSLRMIDIHTGLGPFGHGEKLGLGSPEDVARARRIWGEEVMNVDSGESVSAPVRGDISTAVLQELPASIDRAVMALEYGTVDPVSVLKALRFDNWLHMHGDPQGAEAPAIKQMMRDAFYPDDSAWRSQVYAQAKTALGQALSAD